MEVQSPPPGLPLSISDLQSPGKTDTAVVQESTHHLKLEPIQQDNFKKRRKHRRRKSKALKDSTINSEADSSVDQLSKATDDDIHLYLNERLSRLDSIPNPPRLDPVPQTDEHSTTSQTPQNNDPIHSKTTPPLSGIGLLEPNINETHSSSDNQPLSHNKEVPSQVSSIEAQTEKKRRRARRTKRRQQPLSQSDEDGSTLEQDGLNTSLLTTGSRRELPELSMNAPPSPITPVRDDDGSRSPPTPNYSLSCPTDPIYLVDEEDVHDVPGTLTIQDPVKMNGVKGLGISNTVQSNRETTFNKDESPSIKATYRQVPETGGFVVNRKGQDKGEEYDGEGTDAAVDVGASITNTKFTMIVHNVIKRLSLGAHGILTGLSIWNSAVAIALLNASPSDGNGGHIAFLKYFSDFPLVLHSLCLLFLFFVIVTVFDRLDISKVGLKCIQRCSHNLSQIALTIALFLLLVAFTVTTAIGFIDERIARFHDHPILWSDILYATNVTTGPILTTPLLTVDEQNYYPKNEGQVDSGRLTAWLVLDVIKTLSIFGSWLITFSCALSTDNMEEYLTDLEYQGEQEPAHSV